MIYLCAGLFAEGRTDYDLLLPLVTRLLDDIGARVCPGAYDLAAAIGMDVPAIPHEPRSDRIARTIVAYWDQCTLFIVHADSDGDADRAVTTPAASPLSANPVLHARAWMGLFRG